MRVDPIVERLVGEYVVTQLLLKALDHDCKQAAEMKMGKVLAEWLYQLALKAEREHVDVKRSLRFRQCKIVLQQYEPGPLLHVMYVYRNYEYHCRWMIPLLKARCESKLRIWLQPA